VCSSPRFDPAAANFVNSAHKVCFCDLLPFLPCSRRCLVLSFTTARRTTASGEEGTETRGTPAWHGSAAALHRRLEGQREDGGTHQHHHRFGSIGSALLTRAGEMENHLHLEGPPSPDRGRPPWPRRSTVTALAGTRRTMNRQWRRCSSVAPDSKVPTVKAVADRLKGARPP
jgi:hypothetical protein